VVLNLPDANDTHYSRPARGFDAERAVVPCFIGEENDEDKVDTAHGEDEPEHVAPFSGTRNDEISKQRATVRGGKEDGSPNTDFPSTSVGFQYSSVSYVGEDSLVEEKHIFYETETNSLTSCLHLVCETRGVRGIFNIPVRVNPIIARMP